jgi:hypothetical protein
MVNIPFLKHIKGHQDSHTDYSDLPLDAQLNIDADTEAGFFQNTYPAQRPHIHQLPPSNHAQLHLKGKSFAQDSNKKFAKLQQCQTTPSMQLSHLWKIHNIPATNPYLLDILLNGLNS